MITFIVILLVMGLIAGALARAIVPGHDSMGIGGTIALGIVGSFVGGFLGYALRGKDVQDGAFQASGVVGSVIGAIVVLLVYRFSRRHA
jgi:uncharacterized membrane protein YeaQ/YmgE (transglycosylase-associated protein family)